MTNSNKLLVLLSLVIVILIIVVYVQNNKLATANSKLDRISLLESETLDGGVIRSSLETSSSSDVASIIKDAGIDPNIISDDNKKHDSEIKGVNIIVVRSKDQTVSDIESSRTVKKDTDKKDETVDNDKFGYLSNHQLLSVSETIGKLSIPFGEIGFSAWKEKPWSTKISQRTYESITTISEDKDRRKIIHSALSITVDGNKYVLPIESAKYVEVKRTNEFFFFPRLMLGVDAGISIPASFSWSPNIGVSIFGYGTNRVSPNWFFGSLSVGYNVPSSNLDFVLNPFLYRISNYIPLTENIYIGPGVGIDINKNPLFMFSLRVGI